MEHAPSQEQEMIPRMILLKNMPGLESKLKSLLADRKKSLEGILKENGGGVNPSDKNEIERKKG